MSAQVKNESITYDLLKKYGAKWAVLAAMEADLAEKGAAVSSITRKNIEMSHVKISSGCYSSCEAGCDLNKIESDLVAIGAGYGDEYMERWFDLMSQAMNGELDIHTIHDIPQLMPIKHRLTFMDCSC